MLDNPYLWYKWLHLVSVIAWMAALLYLPRLFVYHAGVAKGSPESEMLKIMERRLLRYIANPAMIAVFLFGGLLSYANSAVWSDGWFHAKLTLIVFLTVFHHLVALWRKKFLRDENTHSQKYFRIANEIPTLLMIAIVFLAVFKLF